MSYEFAKPTRVPTFDVKEHIGDVGIYIMGGVHEGVPTAEYGVKPAVHITVIWLSGEDAGLSVEDVMLFNPNHVKALRNIDPGRAAVMRIKLDGKATMLDEASPADTTRAGEWVTQNRAEYDRLVKEAQRAYEEKTVSIGLKTAGKRAPDAAPQFQPPQDDEPPF